MSEETKNERFKRLARLRGERILKDLGLLGNLSNTNNYNYSDQEVRLLFGPIEDAIKDMKSQFAKGKRRKIEL
jgi:hypothetical protein